MQDEITKMCDLIQDVNRQRGKKKRPYQHSHDAKCSKRQRIIDLERQVRDLQDKQVKTTEATNDTHRSKDVSQQTQQSENKLLQNQVTFLEQRLKQFQMEVNDNKESQQIREQLRISLEENEYLRCTYNKSYEDMMAAFNSFKKEMEKKQEYLEKEYENKMEQLEHQFKDDLLKKGKMIEDLQKENVFLKEKIYKIKDAFELERPASEGVKKVGVAGKQQE